MLLMIFFILTTRHVIIESYQLVDNSLNKEEEDLILKLHNDVRKSLTEGDHFNQPMAEKMQILTYDAALAKIAKNIASTCEFQYIDVDDDRFDLNLNLLKLPSNKNDKASWNAAFDQWLEEFSNYSYGSEINDLNEHFVQIIWNATEYLGCGYSHCTEKDRKRYFQIYVCVYGPAGNVPHVKPYSIKNH